jgi:hypothetical protein
MSYGELSTVPPGQTMATTEVRSFGIDMTNLLASIPNSSISGVSTALQDVTIDLPVALVDVPTVFGNVVTQPVRGSALTVGHNYELRVTFTAAPLSVLTVVLEIGVPL